MPIYSYDHIHLRSKNPMDLAKYFETMFDARIIESIQSDGQPRIDLDINGLAVFIASVPQDADMVGSPSDPHLGLDHFGFCMILIANNLHLTHPLVVLPLSTSP